MELSKNTYYVKLNALYIFLLKHCQVDGVYLVFHLLHRQIRLVYLQMELIIMIVAYVINIIITNKAFL